MIRLGIAAAADGRPEAETRGTVSPALRVGGRPWLTSAVARLLFGLLPVLLLPILAVFLLRSHNFAFDFHGWYWPAGSRVLHGVSPYTFGVNQAFNYPAIAALLFVPFALLPHSLADWIFTICVVAAVPVTLRVLGVRDWRVYGIAMLWQPVVYGLETANVTLLLALGVATAWRYRDTAWKAGTVVALVVSVKLFLLPLCVWLLGTRRYAALAWAVVVGAVVNAGAWVLLGVGELAQYEHTLRAFAASAERRGYSLISLLLQQGTSEIAAYAIAVLGAGAFAVACFRAGRRRRDRFALTACLGASLIGSPVVESHYLALLLVPVALSRPRLSLTWALPLLLWLAPVDHPGSWQRVLTLAVGAIVLSISLYEGNLPLGTSRTSARIAPYAERSSGGTPVEKWTC